MVVHSYNPSTWSLETQGEQIPDQLGQGKTLSQQHHSKRNKDMPKNP